MRPSLRIVLTGVTAGALVCVLASCSGSGSDTAGDGPVTITVSGRPPATDAASLKTFDARVAEFEKANPEIKIKANEYQYDQQSFQTKVGGGSLETVVRVPLTEMSGLIKRKQIADLTADFKGLKHSEDFNEVALGAAKGLDGKIYGIPTEEYALGLVYNRDLFEKAGLDPDRPPATWPEVRAAAKAISEKTDATGYAQMTKENTGGWMLTAMTYSFGDTMQEQSGGKWANTFDRSGSGAEKSLKALKEMRWTDESMGRNQLRNITDVEKDFSAGKIGMTIAGPSMVNHYIQQYKGDPDTIGLGAMPTDGSSKRTLAGGTIAVISPGATPQQREAAAKFIDFYYLSTKYDVALGAKDATAKKKDGAVIGVPSVPFYKPAIADPVQAAVDEQANVPVEHFAPYSKALGEYELVIEPPVEAQNVYKALDSAVQAVLTREDADPAEQLKKAASQVKSQVERAQN
ncbi:extracellular solute-binding protein [Streptomyces sp. Ncost-T10-10d]|uniref:extracellular solute-binding protein n=1 Tax=Streptomyces sp. Ncost-T10-10d TaxID=1839774 RepID=UPI00081D9CD4|nr:extracellular solute-binding protein [Streptomyces sp. Ncost-T10-10d]SCF71548.1 carbohydrate ABC transporter substrate-binding protein, CUT1 family [Streptomyces sp. Ncost-T10-10d]